MKIRLALVCVIFLSASIAGPTAAGGVMLSFRQSSPSPLTVGSSGTIDVMIQSDQTGDKLDAFLVAFTLTPDVSSLDGGSPGGLRFSASQLDLQLNDPEYVFANRSLSDVTGASVGAVSTTIDTNDTFAGLDATYNTNLLHLGDPDPVDLTTEERLLFRLNLDAVTAGTYQIKITSAEFLSATSLLDFPSADVAGTITVTGATAVPEPSSAVILGLACAFGLVLHRARKQ